MSTYKEQQILDKVCKSRDRNKSNTMILCLFSIFNMNKLFSIVSPPTFHLAPRSLTLQGRTAKKTLTTLIFPEATSGTRPSGKQRKMLLIQREGHQEDKNCFHKTPEKLDAAFDSPYQKLEKEHVFLPEK